MDTTRILETRMESTARDFEQVLENGATSDDHMSDIVDANMLRYLAQWALQVKHQSDFDLAKAALQGIK